MNPNITNVYLLNVPLENDYQHTLYFTSREEQESFFKGKVIKSYHFDDFSYQRKDGILNIPMMYDDALKVNYVMYQNTAYNNKWFYAFVSDIDYVNEDCTNLHIETDVMQTYLFDYIMKPSFVEREHVSNDRAGTHTQPELLETGEYIVNNNSVDEQLNNMGTNLCYILATTMNHSTSDNNGNNSYASSSGAIYNGIYSGASYYRWDSPDLLKIWLGDIANNGKSENIVGLFLAPKELAPMKTEDNFAQHVTPTQEPMTYFNKVDKIKNIDGYIPRNNKLFSFPYCYMLVSNNVGASAIYHYEKFNSTECNFTIKGVLTPGCSIRMTPQYYNGHNLNELEGINLGKYPICSYTTDMYTNWLTQNSVNIGVQAGAGVATLTAGLVTLNPVAIGGGVMSIANTIGQVYQHSFEPNQLKGSINGADVITASGNNTFHFYEMCIKKEYAKIIDSYFDMYGYKVNRVKMPNKAHRGRWWFTKTINANIDGAIPQKDLQKIKDCYNHGITFWRNCNEIQNYALSNGIAITEGAITD